jgi:hypothetical protein
MSRTRAPEWPHLRSVSRGILTGLSAAVVAVGCHRVPGAVDLIATARTSLNEASVAGHDGSWVRERVGRPVKISGVVRTSRPADPPSRLVLKVEIPSSARLILTAGIPGGRAAASPVNFAVAVRRGGVESTVASRSLDPTLRPEDREWVPIEADLSKYQGPVDLVLEATSPTHGESVAVRGNPVIIRPDDREAPLVVVYLVDTLRRDHLTLYGYRRPPEPLARPLGLRLRRVRSDPGRSLGRGVAHPDDDRVGGSPPRWGSP